MKEWERYAIKFVALALNEAIGNARTKRVYNDQNKVAIPFWELRFDKSFKSALLRIARRYGLVTYSAVNFDKKPVRVVIVDLNKLNHVIYDDLEEMGSNASFGGLAVAAHGGTTPTTTTTGGDPS